MPIIGQFTPIEVANKNLTNAYEVSRFFCLPLVILLTLFGTIKPKHAANHIIIKVVLTICVSLFSVLILIIIWFASWCNWTNKKVLFKNKKNRNTTIVLRAYGCGAWDSDSPIYKVYKVKKILASFNWVTETDTTNINMQNWLMVIDN